MNYNELYPNCKAMTYGDVEELGQMNAKCKWSFSEEDCKDFLFSHMNALIFVLKHGDDTAMNGTRDMEMIEYRLEDANYHTLAKLLHENDYEGASVWITEEYMDD